MNIPFEKWQYSTMRIETYSEAGVYLEGTAFIYEYTAKDNTYPFLITVKHLVKDATEGRMTFFQGKNNAPLIGSGYTLDVDHFSELWFSLSAQNPQVAVTPFIPFVKHVKKTGIEIYHQSFKHTDVLTTESPSDVAVGDDALYIGYPENCWDRKTLLPVLRKGMLASHYYSSNHDTNKFSFDTTVLRGSAGSPVFYKKNHLLGVLTNLPKLMDSIDGENEIAIYDAELETPMGEVIKFEIIIETIEAYLKEKGVI